MSLSYLDNGTIRVGVESTMGHCIAWLNVAASPSYNYINANDPGRLVQQSYYGRGASGQEPLLADLWNPIQGGYLTIQPTVLSFSNNGTVIYSKTKAVDWFNPQIYDNAIMEQWTELDGNIVKIRMFFTYTGDEEQFFDSAYWYPYGEYGPMAVNELPAVYVRDVLTRFAYYAGPNPWTDGALTLVDTIYGDPGDAAGDMVYNLESWSALVDPATNSGVGLYTPICTLQSYTNYAPEGAEHPQASMYMSPRNDVRFKKGYSYEYYCYLTVGTLTEIRSRFSALHSASVPIGAGIIERVSTATLTGGTVTITSWDGATTYYGWDDDPTTSEYSTPITPPEGWAVLTYYSEDSYYTEDQKTLNPDTSPPITNVSFLTGLHPNSTTVTFSEYGTDESQPIKYYYRWS